jgi:TPR repeat protein
VQCNWEATCPFCRSPLAENEIIGLLNKRKAANDDEAYYQLGIIYLNGFQELRVAKDREKALQLFFRGGELGSANSYGQLASAYFCGPVQKGEKKSRNFYELSAICRSVHTRHTLAVLELQGS